MDFTYHTYLSNHHLEVLLNTSCQLSSKAHSLLKPKPESIIIFMVLQDKYKRANSSRYRASHGGIQSNRQKARDRASAFPDLNQALATKTSTATTTDDASSLDQAADQTATPSSTQSFSRRALKSNADRYLEPEPDPNEEPEPEIDLSKFLEKQRSLLDQEEDRLDNRHKGIGVDDDDIDESFDHLFQHSKHANSPGHSNFNLKKPCKVYVEDPNSLGLDELDNERKKADATRELIARFSGQLNVSTPDSHTCRKFNRPKLDKMDRASESQRLKSVDLVGPLEDEQFLDEVLNDSSGTYGKFKRT